MFVGALVPSYLEGLWTQFSDYYRRGLYAVTGSLIGKCGIRWQICYLFLFEVALIHHGALGFVIIGAV